MEWIIVFNGDGLNVNLLEEVNISFVDVVFVVMDDDKINMLVLVCVKVFGVKMVICLMNDLMFVGLMGVFDIDVYINLCVIMVSLILCYICYGCVWLVYLIGDVEVEMIEV